MGLFIHIKRFTFGMENSCNECFFLQKMEEIKHQLKLAYEFYEQLKQNINMKVVKRTC